MAAIDAAGIRPRPHVTNAPDFHGHPGSECSRQATTQAVAFGHDDLEVRIVGRSPYALEIYLAAPVACCETTPPGFQGSFGSASSRQYKTSRCPSRTRTSRFLLRLQMIAAGSGRRPGDRDAAVPARAVAPVMDQLLPVQDHRFEVAV